MRRWLLTRQSALGEGAKAAELEVFTSGGAEPLQGELSAAVIRLAERQEAHISDDGRFDLVLVPLDEAQGMTFQLEQAASLLSRGSF